MDFVGARQAMRPLMRLCVGGRRSLTPARNRWLCQSAPVSTNASKSNINPRSEDADASLTLRRRRLRKTLDATPPMTFRESLHVEQQRETRKEARRAHFLDVASSTVTKFSERIRDEGSHKLRRDAATIMQINIGKLCNLTCRHCHVESGPSKRRENMSLESVNRCLELLAQSPSTTTVDITGGAPELNPHFRHLVLGARAMGKTVIDRCNLVVLFERGQEDLAQFLADNKVHLVASLPCYTEENTDKQRGKRVHLDSVEAIRKLNEVGYGRKDTGLRLDLVYNPGGAFLPPPQNILEATYRDELAGNYGIVFDSLLALTNMPIKRFADDLERTATLGSYLETLANAFNPATLSGLMCRDTINIQWDGKLYDCDFNAALGLELDLQSGKDNAADIWSIDSLETCIDQPIKTAKHCYGCTAGSGSSCGGSLAV